MLYGYSDPTEDIALVHFVYWGRHLSGIYEETAKRVLELAPRFEIRLHDLQGYRFQLFHFGCGKWKVVPRVLKRDSIL